MMRLFTLCFLILSVSTQAVIAVSDPGDSITADEAIKDYSTITPVTAGRDSRSSAAATAGHFPSATESDDDVVVGLALSGGGAAGLAHIGVLKVLEEAGIPVDVVSGTSMGAVVGGLYALGYTPELMEQTVSNIGWRHLFEESIFRRHMPMEEKKYDGRFYLTFPVEDMQLDLPTGVVSGNYIFNLLARLTWPYHNVEDFRKLPRPFACMATDLETGEPVVLDSGFLPDAIRASMSIPTVFEPVRIDGKYLVDGGILNNLPVEQAFDLGADFVIAVNSSPGLKPADELRSVPDILTQTIAAGIRSTMLIQREQADFYLQPNLHEFTTFSFDKIEEIIREGEIAARSRIDEIRALSDSLNSLHRSSGTSDIPEFEPSYTIAVRNVHFEGLQTVPEEHIRTKLQINNHSTIHEEELEEGLMRLFGMQRFKKITYRLHWINDEADLTIYFEEQTANTIQTGIHHNSTIGPSLLFNATFRNLIYPATTARVNIRVGPESMVEGEYFNYIGLEPRLSFNGSIGFRERETDIYEEGRRQANLRTEILYGEALIGPLYASVIRAGVGYRFEYFNLNESYSELEVPVDWNSLQLFAAELEYDNLNRSQLPTKGHHLQLRADLSPDFLPNEATFGRISGQWDGYYPVSEDVSILQSLRAGHIFGGNPPLHYRFYAGGHRHFWGYQKDALAGKNILTGRVAAQYQFYRSLYLTSGVNVGNVYDKLNFSVLEHSPRWGWAAALSWNTVIGPIEAVFSGSKKNPLLFEFIVGMNF